MSFADRKQWVSPTDGHRRRRVLSLVSVVVVATSILSTLYVFLWPHLVKFRPRLDLTWYDWGLYGFYPSQSYASFEYESPSVEFAHWDPRCDERYTFFAPRGDSIHSPGPMILDAQGELVYLQPNMGVTQDFKVVQYRGESFLAYWEGEEVAGHGDGSWYMLDSTYTQRFEIRPLGGIGGDLHEFMITDNDTALVSIYETIPADLSSIGGPEEGYLIDGVFQEIDIATGELLFEWHASHHYPVNSTYEKLKGRGRDRDSAFDYFHLNSIEKDHEGHYLISARHTHTVTSIDRETGAVRWTLGGRANDFTDASDGAATDFAWQHDARWHGTHTLTLMDNAVHSNSDPAPQSRGMLIDLDVPNRVATLRTAFYHPQQMKVVSQGNVQLVPGSHGPDDDGDHVIVGWGHSAAFTEYTAEGELLCDVHFGASMFFTFGRVVSYRTFKGDWVGRPRTSPSAAVAGDNVYVSWNGATEVATWQLEVWDGEHLDGEQEMAFQPVNQAPRDGFETEIELPAEVHDRFVRVAALDAAGEVLGRTPIVRRAPGWTLAGFFAAQSAGVLVMYVMGGCCLLLGMYWGCHLRMERWRAKQQEYHLVPLRDEEASPE
ncbi:hypothetical protein ASPZODRAFT_76544 [Penicilliopsis zonata CBS 506.65]|uniref:Uncharacterized protein n=1 Tax=Penicilliopsis zonata CBS 506.65 TaxID=1073090 RepID=A0A1L9S5T4_9EURO|nr:hypothetical protein ASPZODRAFT_76544 [Penicilliopsis zonata CBS 506.65]OJJ42525.1 hypothetical protein ASPZODRAFT_76544 [Penicilliopsis zonata CBS 506.65]